MRKGESGEKGIRERGKVWRMDRLGEGAGGACSAVTNMDKVNIFWGK